MCSRDGACLGDVSVSLLIVTVSTDSAKRRAAEKSAVTVKLALDMPLESIFKTELAPASVTIISWYPDGHPVLRLFNGRPSDVLFDALSF